MKDQQLKLLSDLIIKISYKTVNIGCMNKESYPSLFVNDVIDWNISDPTKKSLEDIRIIHDTIKSSVMILIKTLEATS